ncbi:MAG: hypothetical protein HDQ87_02415 [Clostridia bacterium]|nr:hypothetical protein [Clostridia bacterium]
MSVFSKLSQKLKSQEKEPVPAEQTTPAPPPAAPAEPQQSVYGDDGFDQFGYDRDGFSRKGFDRSGHRRGIDQPIDRSKPLEQEIEKYRRADGYMEYERAVYANFRDLKDNFEGNREDIAEIIYNLLLADEKRAVELWKWLLSTFESTLDQPADAFRIGSGILYSLEKRGVSYERILDILKDDPKMTEQLFALSSHIDARYARLLTQALLLGRMEQFEAMMDLLLKNKFLGKGEALPVDKILKTTIENIAPTDMTNEIYAELQKYIKRSTKMMMRKALTQLLEENMSWLRAEEERRKEEAERNAKLEAQRRKFAEELTSQQKEAGSRLTQRKLKASYNELKAASIANRKANPTWQGGEFADFQQLEGLMVPEKGKQSILDTLLPDDKLYLVRESYNPNDSMAIMVKDEAGNKIGYIPNRSNTLLALLMDHGQKVFGRVFSIGREPDSDIVQCCVEIFMED